jgi:hypothetical protein
MDSHADDHRREAERARETAKQAVSARERAFWSALAANWEKLAKEAEAPRENIVPNQWIKKL